MIINVSSQKQVDIYLYGYVCKIYFKWQSVCVQAMRPPVHSTNGVDSWGPEVVQEDKKGTKKQMAALVAE